MNSLRGRFPGQSSPGTFQQRCSLLWMLSSAIAVSLVAATHAAVLLDPFPEPSTTQFGYVIGSMGDVNGDGVPDFAVGAPFQDGDFVSTDMGFGLPANVGKVFVVDGATLTVLNEMTDPDFELIQPQHFGGQLGASLSVSPDVDGDGVADIVAGAPQFIANPDVKGETQNVAGKALVFSGQNGSLLFTLSDPTAEEDGKVGTAVAALGDVDADGKPDFAVGGPGKDIGGEDGIANVGLVYIFSGRTGRIIRTLNDPPRGGAEAGAAFGSSLANAGDINGDGVADLIIGAPGESHVYVFNGKTGTLIYDIVSPVAESVPSFGSAVSGGQDFNRDGKPDIVIGAPLQNNFTGAAYMYNGATGSLIRRLRSPARQAFSRFGAAVLASPDLTGDGRADVIVGAPAQNVAGLNAAGEAWVFDGVRGRVSETLLSAAPQFQAGFGSALASALFSGTASTAVIGVPYQDANINIGGDTVPHLQVGQIEILQ